MRYPTLLALTVATAFALPAQAQQAAPAQPNTASATTAPAATASGQAAPAAQAAPATPAATTTIAAALPTLPNHSALLRLVRAAKLEALLSGPGPYTLLAPTDEAFGRLPPGTMDAFLAPANIASLTTILKNHIINGAMTADQIKAAITAGGGRATLTTLSGQPIVATLENGNILLTDAVNNKSYIDTPDLREANGVIHVTNGISLPKLG
jgi:uncharacterized surface protein with fasciclin (FAS1) repeats